MHFADRKIVEPDFGEVYVLTHAPRELPKGAGEELTHLAILVSASLFVARLRSSVNATERTLHLHTWQLRQLVPSSAHGAVTSAPPPEAPLCIIRS